MKIVGRNILEDFKQKHADVRPQVDSWEAEVKDAKWGTPHDVTARYPSASILHDKRVIFNLKRYRLSVLVSYKNQTVLVEKMGTHDEYMRW